jgi:2'-5' RNA ligase
MLLHASIVPPPAVLEAVANVLQSIDRPVAEAVPLARKGFLGRFGSRGVHAAAPSIAAVDELDLIATEDMQLPITTFGNVTADDALKLAEALNEAAAEWTRPTVHIVGGTALEFPGDRSVWAKLEGDVAALTTIARGVTQSVERLGFFVDRRKFRPALSVATVNEATTAPYLQAVVDGLDAFR